MPKLFALLKAPDDAGRAAFMASVLASAPGLLEEFPGIGELIVDLVDVDPGDAEWVRPGEARKDSPATPAYDAVIELSGPDDLIDRATAAIERDWRARTGLLWLYRTTLMPARVNRAWPAGRSPGVKYIVLCRFHADMPASAVQRSWAHHVPLALRVHIGADIYIRHWIDEVITPGAPPEQGVTELHFPTWEDMRERWFVSDEARQRIVQDIGHFLASGTRLYTSEHVLKSPDPA